MDFAVQFPVSGGAGVAEVLLVTCGIDGISQKRIALVNDKAVRERANAARELRGRPDFHPDLGYFIERLDESIEETAARLGRRPVGVLCLQAPFEIFHALGLSAYRLFCGGQAYGRMVVGNLPALTCPLVRSTVGSLVGGEMKGVPYVIPATCDWVVKFPEMAAAVGAAVPETLHWLELPHLKDQPAGQRRWAEEIRRLVDFLENVAGRSLTAKALRESMEAYQYAWTAFSSLIDLRRHGRVPAAWFSIVANAFLRDAPESWADAVMKILPLFKRGTPAGKRVFLAGSPFFYPNLKMHSVIEEAGLAVTADDLCSSERIFPGAVFYRDPSLDGLLAALAERYHQGCTCPTFADNDRRSAAILGQADFFDGVVLHVLKGCHPYDLESFTLERRLKERGIRFLRLETDYAEEDRQNLLTRLEAFRAII